MQSRRTDGFSRTRRNERLSHYVFFMFVLDVARGQATVCASPTLKRLVRKYNYSEDVRVNVTADGGEAHLHLSAIGPSLTIITSHRNN